MKKKRIGFILAFSVLLLSTTPSSTIAGKLDEFEREATSKNDDESEESSSSFIDEFLSGLFEGLIEGLFSGSGEGGASSSFTERSLGNPTVPFIRFDLNYQNVESDVEALDGRLELGYGPLGLQYRHTHYKELNPKDTLDSLNYLGLLRISDAARWELDMGLGALTLKGDQTATGFSMSIPIQYHFDSKLGLEFRPAWSWISRNRINDYDLRLVYTYKIISINAGYRWFNTSGADLNGVQFGTSIHF